MKRAPLTATKIERELRTAVPARLHNEEIAALLGNLPYMTIKQASKLTVRMDAAGATSVLELGFFHGVSTCYIANALSARNGHLTCIDLERAFVMEPNVEQLLEKTGLRDRVTVHYEPTSYVWRLMKLIEENKEPIFDFCYIDGSHSWFVDGFAFFLVDRLLKPGGWVVLDDIDWTYEASKAMRNTPRVKRMPEEERTTPQIRKIFELLVCRQPGYGNFELADGWGWAQKLPAVSKPVR
jgi:predicted O-methyltransferase YrrM